MVVAVETEVVEGAEEDQAEEGDAVVERSRVHQKSGFHAPSAFQVWQRDIRTGREQSGQIDLLMSVPHCESFTDYELQIEAFRERQSVRGGTGRASLPICTSR